MQQQQQFPPHASHQQQQQQQHPPNAHMQSHAPNSPPSNNHDSYFTESRKGEVNELRTLLRNFATEKDPQKKREIIKKVIAYMTLGIDVSRLFTEMMLAIETRDLVIKKMVYLYMSNYATTHPQLAQMCTNTLQKDCGNEDPMVRGLALRALCSLRLPEMVEYISEPLRKALSDHHAYVRKTGVMGMLKLYHLDQDAFHRCNFKDILYDMIRDPDAQVVSNCILVLNEVMSKEPEGGMAINRAVMLHLLNRIHQFSEFGIVAVLDLIPRYIPANQDEGYQIMNLLDPVLRTSNSGAVLATIKAFMSLAEHLGENSTEMKQQVVIRVKAPLITHVSSGSSELVYCLMKHVDALVNMVPGVFDDEYRQFYVRYHEPTHIKYLKVDVLSKLANPDTAPDIVAELTDCVASTDVTMSRLSVRALSRIACRNTGGEGCAESIARRLVEMLDLSLGHVCSEAATALKDIIRKHPTLKSLIAPPLPRALKYTTEASGKASIIWLLGECGDIINEAPYSLEKLIDGYEDIKDPMVKLALLSSTVKLFFKRPPEVQKMLGRLLSQATQDVSSQDLHDRALLYYRLLKTSADPKVVEGIVNTETLIQDGVFFAEEQDDEQRALLMEEFNTLSILYDKTSESFIAEEYQVKYMKMPAEHPLAPNAPPMAPPPTVDVAGTADHLGTMDLNGTASPPAAPPAPAPAPVYEVDLLGFSEEPALPVVAPPATSTLTLNPSVAMTGDVYQSKWGAVPDVQAISMMLPLRTAPPNTGAVETALAKAHVLTIASGELETEFKFFLYAQNNASSGTYFLLQAILSKTGQDANFTIKVNGDDDISTHHASATALMELVKGALASYV